MKRILKRMGVNGYLATKPVSKEESCLVGCSLGSSVYNGLLNRIFRCKHPITALVFAKRQ